MIHSQNNLFFIYSRILVVFVVLHGFITWICLYFIRLLAVTVSCMRQTTLTQSTWSCYWLDQFLSLAISTWIFVEIFNVSLDLSTNHSVYFSGCRVSIVYSCCSILECNNLFSGVKLGTRSLCFIYLNICFLFCITWVVFLPLLSCNDE